MSSAIKRQQRSVVATLEPLVASNSGTHRLRHHGKHHELWRHSSGTLQASGNTTTTGASLADRATVCYTTNEVLMIIGLTCVLNLAFIAVVMSCVHFCSSPTVAKISRLESLILVENSTSESDLEEFERKPTNLNLFTFSPTSGRYVIEDYLKSLPLPLQVSMPSSRSASLLSLQTLVPACYTTSSPANPRHRLEPLGTSVSMENLLFV